MQESTALNTADFTYTLEQYPPSPSAPASGQSSLSTVFTLWNTMISTTIVAMPWAIEQAGIVLGLSISHSVVVVVVGFVSYYTCSIIVKIGFALSIDDTSDIVMKMWGKWGKRGTIAVSAMLMIGALMACNVIINGALYSVLDALCYWSTGSPIGECTDCWTSFSTKYSPFLLMLALTPLLTMKQKSSYLRLNSKGALPVIIIVVFICAVGVRALLINSWTTHGSSNMYFLYSPQAYKRCSDDWNCVSTKREVHIDLYANGFLVTAGVMTLSFFIHNTIVILLKGNKCPEHNGRDMGIGFAAVGVSYFALGLLGFFGFSGNGFPQGAIDQNALNMFQSTNPFAFVIRLVLIVQVGTVYPMLAYCIRVQIFDYLYGTDFPSRRKVVAFSLTVTSITTLVTIVYPNVGTIVAFFGAVCGLYFIYLTPVAMYFTLTTCKSVPDAVVNETLETTANTKSFLMDKEISVDCAPAAPSTTSKALHCLIPVMGIVILVFQFVPPADL